MPTVYDLHQDRVQFSFLAHDKQTNALATATKAAAAARHHVITTVDASYSTSTTSGLLTIKFGTTTIAEKYIHGAGGMDFGSDGYLNTDANEAVSAELAAGGAGVLGTVTLSGYTTSPFQ